MAEQGLKDKTVKGTFWSTTDAFLGPGVTFLVGVRTYSIVCTFKQNRFYII